ncbi:PQQ-like beta-propeller repeat protein [Alkalilacustris brevis]|uniref:PQQ-like beta-propeller repeat protein n=1 Tax=Alkalilacustris brevis TaxID=2026338 RepID=UPI000E0D131F|nr:PQQ-like beta-propeller repeat protein [Alkalilacustris brevis]
MGLIAGLALLMACERELILEGERLDLRALTVSEPAEVVAARAAPISLPSPAANSDWTHRGGDVSHSIPHPALSGSLTRVWSAPIGAAESRRQRITTDPVVAGGRIFTLDSQARVTATSTNGETLWQRDLVPSHARAEHASGGGLAVGAGRLFVTSAFGSLTALDPATGDVAWTQRFDAPVTAPPVVAGQRVYVVSNEGAAYAVDVENGRLQSRIEGLPSASAVAGGAAPALTSRLVLLPFASGDLVATLRDSGIEVWRQRVAGRRQGQAYGLVSDITGDPVVAGNTVFIGNHAGRVMALDTDSGSPRWTAREGSNGPVWPVGGSVFMLNDRGELVRLDGATGERVWAVELPYYLDERERRRAEIVAHHGPVLAGGRLLVASNDGLLRGFDPVSGELIEQVEVPRGATTNPVVAGQTLYLVSTDGRLHAYR